MAKYLDFTILNLLKIMDRLLDDHDDSRDLPEASEAKYYRKPVKNTARRFPIEANVLILKNDRYVKGRASNISTSGIFIETGDQRFTPNERVKLYIKPEGHGKSYRAIGTVIRYGDGFTGNQGYGLRFSTFSLSAS